MNPEKRERNLICFDRVMRGESVRKVGADWDISQSRLYEVIRDQLIKRGFMGNYGRWLYDARKLYAAGELREAPPEPDTLRCGNGHLYTPKTTSYRCYSDGGQHRICLVCRQYNNREYVKRARLRRQEKAKKLQHSFW